MFKFKIKLLYNKKHVFCNKTEWSNFMVTLLLAKLGIVGSKLLSNSYSSPDDTPVIFSELSIGVKNKKFYNHHHL